MRPWLRRRLPGLRWRVPVRRLPVRRRLRLPAGLRRLRRLRHMVGGRRLLPVVGRLRALLDEGRPPESREPRGMIAERFFLCRPFPSAGTPIIS